MTKRTLKKTPRKKEKASVGAKIAMVTFAFILIAGFLGLKNNKAPDTSDNSSLSSTSVKILSSNRSGGGTGVIYRSYGSESQILTNSHVCEVVQNGGIVETENSSYQVTGYYQSKAHDLCMIKVAANLKVNTQVASQAPVEYDEAVVSGHPRLLPNVVSRGHFSGREIIEVMTGFRKCTEEDFRGENGEGLICALIGGIPQITRYEAQLVTALIQPGSSGSAIFNKDGEISAVVFAGNGGLSYSFSVPYGSVANFVFKEAILAEFKIPQNSYDLNLNVLLRQKAHVNYDARLKEACSNLENIHKSELIAKACKLRETNMIWNL